MVVTSLPALLVGPFAGAYVDRWDRKRTMIICDLIRIGAILCLPWMAAINSRIPLYLDILLLFAVASFFVPARLAMIPDLAPPDRLAKANALFTTSGMIGSAITVLVGALLVEWAGITRSCWVNAAAYLASAVFIAPIARGAVSRHEPEESARMILAEVWEGLCELWRHQDTRRVIALLGFLVAGAGASMLVGTVLVQHSLGSVTKDLGFLSLWFGAGMFLGTVGYGRWGTHHSKRVVLGAAFLGCGVSLGCFLVAVVTLKSGVAASFTTALLGCYVAPVGIVANTLIHEAHPERLHGRIFSSLGIVVNLSLIASLLTAGWLVERGGHALLLGVIGTAFAGGGIALLNRVILRFGFRSKGE